MYVQWGWIGGLGPMHSPLHTHTLHSYNTNQPPPTTTNHSPTCGSATSCARSTRPSTSSGSTPWPPNLRYVYLYVSSFIYIFIVVGCGVNAIDEKNPPDSGRPDRPVHIVQSKPTPTPQTPKLNRQNRRCARRWRGPTPRCGPAVGGTSRRRSCRYVRVCGY